MMENTSTATTQTNMVTGDSLEGYRLYSTISSYQHLIRNKYKHKYNQVDKLIRLEEKAKEWALQLYHTY